MHNLMVLWVIGLGALMLLGAGCLSLRTPVGLSVLQLSTQDGRPPRTRDPRLETAERSFAAKRGEIVSSVVTPCRNRVEALAGEQEEHEKSCDCFDSESERQQSLATLRRMTQQALARCDLKGLDAEIAYIDQRGAAVRAALRDMIGKFQAQTSAFESWGSDAERGKKEAQDKIGQILISSTLGAMVDNILETNEKELTRRLDDVIEHAARLRDVRRVRKGELKDVVAALKKQLAGKSKAEAKQIIVDNLNAVKLALADAADVEKQLAEAIIDTNIPRDDEPSAEEKTQSYLEREYASLLTGLEIAARHGVKDARLFARAAGVLALAPDAIDVAAILYNAAAIEDNINGLDQLRAAAARQRASLGAEIRVFVARRRAIAAERNSITQRAKL